MGTTRPSPLRSRVEYGETWVYESIVGALPGVDLTDWQAVAVQFLLFEGGILLLAWVYDLWAAAVAGTVAVVVAAVGSVAMLWLGATTRRLPLPTSYRRVLFGSSIEVVLGLLAFIALVTHLFVFDPQNARTPLVETLFGPDPPILVVYLTLLVLWDLCYRIGTSWWTAVVGLWRSVRFRFDPETAGTLRRLDGVNALFGATQAALLPFVLDQPVLLVAVGGHVGAVTVVSAAALALVRTE
jgi:hypothetical protein